jgi:hypothetical protein
VLRAAAEVLWESILLSQEGVDDGDDAQAGAVRAPGSCRTSTSGAVSGRSPAGPPTASPTSGSPTRSKATLYLLAASIGYRRGELFGLTPASFSLDTRPPNVTVEAAYTKAGRGDSQPISADVAETIRP